VLAAAAVRRYGRRLGHAYAVVHETSDALVLQRAGVLVRIDRHVRQRVAADRVQHAAVVFRDDLDVPVEKHPIARLGCVSVAGRVPATMSLRVLQH
jgi:hypothetical protein